MSDFSQINETIVAIATPPGRGGVGIVRVSGPLAYAIGLKIAKATKFLPRVALYCPFFTATEEQLDQGMVLFFKAPHSFTGEDVIELQGHGAPLVMDRLVQTVVELGARLARPGEFSERAFLNDKIDLTQAEAIADLIGATSLTAARSALRSLQGEFSAQIGTLNEQLIHLRLYVEAAIDFPEEEIDFFNDGKMITLLQQIRDELALIRQRATQGVMLRDGLTVVIAGRPNAGKSTLINRLAGREVAIVTDIAGTTRDVMREFVTLDGLPIHLIDTAGLHDSLDIVEQEGIKRAWEEVKRADCVLMILDALQDNAIHESLSQAVAAVLSPEVPVIKVMNKIDLLDKPPAINEDHVFLSARSGLGIAFLIEKIKQVAGFHPGEGQFIARRRHLDALDKAAELLTNGFIQLKAHKAGELLAEDLRLAHDALAEITGEFSSDDLLGKIFSSFCIGK